MAPAPAAAVIIGTGMVVMLMTMVAVVSSPPAHDRNALFCVSGWLPEWLRRKAR